MARKFELEITELGNDAFADGDGRDEVARLLREAADWVERYGPFHEHTLHDCNGNAVGRLATWG